MVGVTAGSTNVAYPEVVTFGESMALFSSSDTRGLEYSQQVMKSFGGAESNVAIGLSRLGHHAGWFSRLGTDPLGRYIMKSIRGEGVDVSRIRWCEGVPTGLMMREQVAGHHSVYYYRKLSAASTMHPDDLDEAYIRSAKILHVTGITCALSAQCAETVLSAIRMAKDAGVLVSFDPNLRLKLWSIEEARAILLPIAELADLFLPGLDELKLLYDTEHEEVIFERLSTLKGTSIVKGGLGMNYVVYGSKIVEVPYTPVDHVVDTVGAGDAFCAGVLSGILRYGDPVEAVKLGNITGAMVVQAFGDWEATPTWQQVQDRIHQTTHIER